MVDKDKKGKKFMAAWLSKLEKNHYLMAIRMGFIQLIPVIVIGAVANMLIYCPFPDWYEFQSSFVGSVLRSLLLLIYQVSAGAFSVYLCFSVSYYLLISEKQYNISLQISAVTGSIGCFFMAVGIAGKEFSLSDLGTSGSLLAVLSALFCTTMLCTLYGSLKDRKRRYYWKERWFLYTGVRALLAFFLTCAIWAGIIEGLRLLTGVGNPNRLLEKTMLFFFSHLEGETERCIWYIVLEQLFSFFGVHGSGVMQKVSSQYFDVVFVNGNKILFDNMFLSSFIMIGGSGTTFCLLLAGILFARKRSIKKLSFMSLPFALFNINEPLVLGLPIVFSPVWLIPYLLVPLVAFGIAGGATALGILPRADAFVVWSTPPLLNGYLTTSSIWAVVVQLLILAIGTAIYLPFLRLLERSENATEKYKIQEFTKLFWSEYGSSEVGSYLERTGWVASTAGILCEQLQEDIVKGKIPVWYQPQFDTDKKIIGAEALLRWRYNGIAIAPPIVCRLAEEAGLMNEMTLCICRQVLNDLKKMQEKYSETFKVALNTIPSQIDDSNFVDKVLSRVKEHGQVKGFALEITENENLNQYPNISQNIRRLSKEGIALEIDDFSMGATSLKYLQTEQFGYVKLDGDIVRQVKDNSRNREIVRSVIMLGERLQFDVIAEYVEDEQLFEMLRELGCKYFQGYLIGAAVPIEEFLER